MQRPPPTSTLPNTHFPTPPLCQPQHGPATDDSFSSRGWRPRLCGFALRVVGHSSQCGSRSEGAKGIKSQDRGRSDVERAIKDRSEEHTSELQSLMRISYAVFCLKKKKQSNDLLATIPHHA